jgi:O-antigen ligase
MTELNPPSNRMLNVSASILGSLLCISILIMWMQGLWIVPTFFQAALYLLAAFWAIRMVYHPYRVQMSFVLLPIAITVGWALLQLAIHSTVSRWETWYAAFTWTGNLTACFLALQICQSPKVRRRFLDALLLFALVISIVSTLQHFSSPKKIFGLFEDPGRSIYGPFTSYDRYAMFAELIMPIAVVRALRQEQGQKTWWFLGIAATLFASVIAGASRAGSALILAEALILPVAAYYRGGVAVRRLKVTTARFALFAVIFTLVVGYTYLLHRFDEKDPYADRKGILLGTIAMARARPWFGFGLRNFANAYPAYAVVGFEKIVNEAHNDWAQWAAEGGIPLFLVMLSMAVWTVPRAFRSLWGIGILALFAHGLVDFPLQNATLEFWTFSLLGVLAAEARTQQNESG